MTVIWGTTPYDGYMGSPLYDGLRDLNPSYKDRDAVLVRGSTLRGWNQKLVHIQVLLELFISMPRFQVSYMSKDTNFITLNVTQKGTTAVCCKTPLQNVTEH